MVVKIKGLGDLVYKVVCVKLLWLVGVEGIDVMLKVVNVMVLVELIYGVVWLIELVYGD